MKKVFVVMMVKNEEDIIGYNIEWLQTQDIDHIFIANNMSTDNTENILKELSEKYKNITIYNDNQFAYEQSSKMNRWINQCYEMGADIIIPIDADEIWHSKIHEKTLGQVLKENGDSDCVFEAIAVDFIPTENDTKSNNPFESMIYVKENSDSFQSVAFTKHLGAIITMGNHSIDNHPGNSNIIKNLIGIKHYQYRNFEQFVKKMRNGKRVYDETTMPEYIGSHWRILGSMKREELLDWWNNYVSQPVKLYEGI